VAFSGELALRARRPVRAGLELRLAVRPGLVGLAVTVAAWAGARIYLASKAYDYFLAEGGGNASMTTAVAFTPLLALGTWALIVAVARQAVGARWPRLVAPAVALLLGVAIWTHQVPSDQRPWWYPDLAPVPLAGMPWLPSSPPVIVLWQLAWLALDVGLVLGVARYVPALRPGVAAPACTRHLPVVLAVQAAGILALAYTTPLIGGEPATLARAGVALRDVAPVLLLGLLAGLTTRSSRRAWVLAAALSGAIALDAVAAVIASRTEWGFREGAYRLSASGPDGWDAPPGTVREATLRAGVTIAMVAVLASTTVLSRLLTQLERRPLTALQIGLVLNSADAVATWAGIRTGAVEEGNPLVRHSGLGLKWVVATALLLVLWRLRPQLLWVIVAAYAAVVAYHLLGATVLA
jgi:hypothetical protein